MRQIEVTMSDLVFDINTVKIAGRDEGRDSNARGVCTVRSRHDQFDSCTQTGK